jgi:hypothetical protein
MRLLWTEDRDAASDDVRCPMSKGKEKLSPLIRRVTTILGASTYGVCVAALASASCKARSMPTDSAISTSE